MEQIRKIREELDELQKLLVEKNVDFSGGIESRPPYPPRWDALPCIRSSNDKITCEEDDPKK